KDVEIRDFRRGRHEIAGIFAVEEAALRRISFRLLKQGLSDAPGDPADGLAACGLWIDDPAAVIGTHKTVQSDEPKFGIHVHLGEYCGEAEGGLRSFCRRIIVSIARQRGKVIPREQLAISDI